MSDMMTESVLGGSEKPTTIPLRDADASCGAKAARLGEALRAGFPVPDGFVVRTTLHAAFLRDAALGADPTPEAVLGARVPASITASVQAAYDGMGGGAVAVRSSAVGEDGSEASFAGQFDTFLDVRGADAVVDAVRKCWASAAGARARTYATRRGRDHGEMAVLVQRMVSARAAGVAFTADPVTGDRAVARVSAVRGIGEALVSGERDGDEWLVRGDRAEPEPGRGEVLGASEALAVAALARRVEAHAGHPVDIEWALAGADVVLLQSRPMTALPDVVSWEPPIPGGYARHFRLGEWIGDPVTPLFESWLVTRLEDRFMEKLAPIFGITPPERSHIVVNGWYFYSLIEPMPAGFLPRLRAIATMLWSLCTRFRFVAGYLPPIAHLGLDLHVALWREEIAPRYRAEIEAAMRDVASASPAELCARIDRVATAAGDLFLSVVVVAGYAAKAELPLFEFYRDHLAAKVGGSPLELVRGLGDHAGAPPAHAVSGLDWSLPTLGEIETDADADHTSGAAAVTAARLERERECRAALAGAPRLQKRFDGVLARAQRAHELRQEQCAELTLGWPAMRAALARLGEALVARGTLARPDDVHFVEKRELDRALVAPLDLRAEVAERRARWDRQRRLAPPLVIGALPAMWRDLFGMIDRVVGSDQAPLGAIRGMPASPGRITAKVRVLRGLDELDRLRPGEILVAPVTTPGWTPAFARACAVITDTGSLASHASVVAREYGIPAVVATGDATRRLRDGQRVTVDGTRGLVEV